MKMCGPSHEAARARELGKTAARLQDFQAAMSHYERAVGWQPEEMDNWSCLAEVMMDTEAYREVRTLVQAFCSFCECTKVCSV